MKYCTICGNKLEERKVGIEWYCLHCKKHFYANPIPTVDAVLFDEEGRILLGRRSVEPNIGKLNLPGGFVNLDETFEQAISRELYEELGLKRTDYGEFVYAGSRVDHHIQEAHERQLLSVIMVTAVSHRDFDINEEVSEYLWVLPSELTVQDMTNQYEYDHLMTVIAHYPPPLRLN